MQVMGHTKTICVLLGGALVFGDAITARVALGMSLAVAGMVGYGYFTSREKSVESTPTKNGDRGGEAEAVRLLSVSPSELQARSAAAEAAASGSGDANGGTPDPAPTHRHPPALHAAVLPRNRRSPALLVTCPSFSACAACSRSR